MAHLIKPQSLQPGSHVRVVSPASALTPDRVEKGVVLLESEGYEVSFGRHVFAQSAYYAGTDAQRAADLMEAFTDPKIDCIMCSRGGYGCARLFPFLDLEMMASSGKMFCGFSDITTLHLALNRRGLVTMHTPMMITLGTDREPWVYESFKNCLKGLNPVPKEASRATCLTPGIADGHTTGGCMCLLTDSLSTEESLDCRRKLVLIEDVDENPHRVDAMLTHLINSGQIQTAAGILIGEMTGTDEKNDPTIGSWPWREQVADRFGNLGIPLVIDFPFGHMKTMLSIPMGLPARLDAAQGTLTYLESQCA